MGRPDSNLVALSCLPEVPSAIFASWDGVKTALGTFGMQPVENPFSECKAE